MVNHRYSVEIKASQMKRLQLKLVALVDQNAAANKDNKNKQMPLLKLHLKSWPSIVHSLADIDFVGSVTLREI